MVSEIKNSRFNLFNQKKNVNNAKIQTFPGKQHIFTDKKPFS